MPGMAARVTERIFCCLTPLIRNIVLVNVTT